MRISNILMAGLAVAAGFAASRFLAQRARNDSGRGQPFVRQAGPEHMSNPPRRWSAVDEMSDESFPASDPPGVY